MDINITKPTGVILKTAEKYCSEDITVIPVLEDIIVTPTTTEQIITPTDGKAGISKVTVNAAAEANLQSKTVTAGVENITVNPDTGFDGLSSVTVQPTPTETKSATPSTSAQTITPSSGKHLASVSISAIQTETKSVTPAASSQTVTPTTGKYLTSVTVAAVPSQTKSATPTKQAQIVSPDTDTWLSSVTVEAIPDNYIDTSDATAADSDIALGKTAYVNGVKLVGTLSNAADTAF